MTSKRRQNIARAASREAANMRANGSGPQLIRLALTAGDQSKTLDAFRCDACHGITVTVDRHPGYHPRFVDHRQFDPERVRCPGLARSLEYPDDLPSDVVPSHEWYRPSEDELTTLEDRFVDHVLRGGTLLRIIPLERQEAGR